MRAIGTSKVLSWRWSPCLALALGACSFAAFALLAIPERIGDVTVPPPGDASLRFGSTLASTRTSADSSTSVDESSSPSTSNTFSALPSNANAPHAAANVFPKRGFTPPLDRPDPPPAPPPVVAQQPALELQPQAVATPVPPPPDAPPPQAEPQTASASIEQGVRNAD